MILTSRRILAATMVLWGLIAEASVLSAADAPQASRWPMRATASDRADVTIFQPQLESFEGDTLTGRAAVAVVSAGQQEPVYGTVWLQSRVETDRVARTVRIVDVNVTKVLFPSPSSIATQPLSDAVRQAILSHPIEISLDHLLASVEAIQKEQTAAADLEVTPPAIIFRDHPAVKVQYDGTPKMVQASDAGLMRVVNTPFFVAMGARITLAEPATGLRPPTRWGRSIWRKRLRLFPSYLHRSAIQIHHNPCPTTLHRGLKS